MMRRINLKNQNPRANRKLLRPRSQRRAAREVRANSPSAKINDEFMMYNFIEGIWFSES